jgi:hypothetical protein
LEIQDIIVHPDYAINGGDHPVNDIAVVILKQPVQGIEPVTLAPVGLLDQLKASGALRDGDGGFTAVGYGNDLAFPHPKSIVSDGLRRSFDIVFGGVTKRWLVCLFNPVAHGGGINNGDSGGPAFWADPITGELTQVGVTSTATPMRVGYGHYWRIDLPEARAFIDAVLADVAAEED